MNGRPFAGSATPVEVNPSASPFIFPRYSTGSAPAAPSALAATTISTTEIDLTWTDNSSNEVTFRIERANVTDSIFSEIGSVSAGVTSYNDTTVSNMNGYRYRVRARNTAGNSAYSNTASAMTWGLASEGNLTVDGVDHVWVAGAKHDYGVISVINGGRLLTDNTLDGQVWTQIACTSLSFDAVSSGNVDALVTGNGDRTVSTIAPDGTILSLATTQSGGGNGGTSIRSGGEQFAGNGGGGASGAGIGLNADISNSGAGANGLVSGGASVAVPAMRGNDGSDDDESITGNEAIAGGGSGGTRGRHGGTIYFRINGAFSSLGGTFSANGENGADGGNGGNAETNAVQGNEADGGNGGGAGAGGNGGKIVIRYHSGSDPTAFLSVNPGVTGSAGSGGAATGGVIPAFNNPGVAGQIAGDGSVGVLDVASF